MITDGLNPLTVLLFVDAVLAGAALVTHLILRNNDAETRFIVGHENSLLHGKTTFALVRVPRT